METKYILLLSALFVYIVVVYLFARLGARREIGIKRLFWVSLILTPVIGLAFLLSSQHRKLTLYTEERYKCDECGYVFSENHENCPFCEKEGEKHALKPVSMYMT